MGGTLYLFNKLKISPQESEDASLIRVKAEIRGNLGVNWLMKPLE